MHARSILVYVRMQVDFIMYTLNLIKNEQEKEEEQD